MGKINKEEYAELVEEYTLMLLGRHDELESLLAELMQKSAKNQQYERAARYRDRLRAVQRGRQAQRATFWNQLPGHRDIFGLARMGPDALVQLLIVREGRVVGQQPFPLSAPSALSDGSVLEAFLKQYYIRATEIPDEVILPIPIPDAQFLEEWLTHQREEAKTNENAQFHLHQLVERLAADEGRRHRAYAELVNTLHLPKEPSRIEGFDISTLQGTASVGVCVVFLDALPAKKEYRRFKIREVEGQDDFAMMREVVERRYRRRIAEKAPLPDLILIDGGPGQVSMAKKVLESLERADLAIVGLAKGDQNTPDSIYLPGQSTPLLLSGDSEGLRLLMRVRDEAHRFAIAYHRKLRTKQSLHLTLTDIPGVGKHRAALLLEHFHSIEKLGQASVKEIAAVPTISPALAEEIAAHLAGRD
jgi:excinuclease ABC subunit C